LYESIKTFFPERIGYETETCKFIIIQFTTAQCTVSLILLNYKYKLDSDVDIQGE